MIKTIKNYLSKIKELEMTVKELIKQLKTFDESHHVVVDVTWDGCRSNKEIEEVYFNGFACIRTDTSE